MPPQVSPCARSKHFTQDFTPFKGFYYNFLFLVLIMRDSITLKTTSIGGKYATLTFENTFNDELQQSDVAHLQGDTLSRLRHYDLNCWPGGYICSYAFSRHVTFIAEDSSKEHLQRQEGVLSSSKSCNAHNIAALFMSQLQTFSTSLDSLILDMSQNIFH